MTLIKVNDQAYPAVISGRVRDPDWDDRPVKAITLTMSYDQAVALLPDGAAWSIVERLDLPVWQTDEAGGLVLGQDGQPIQTGVETRESEWDNADYCLSGPVTDHRDGTVTVKMGRPTELEDVLALLLGGV